MKRLMLLIVIMIMACAACFAEETNVTAVVNMQYTVHFDGYDREGLYTGGVKDGVPEGFGVFVTHNAQGMEWRYIGQWENGQFSGDGAQYWENGQVHKGAFKANQQISGYAFTESRLLTEWLDEYDADGNQHFVSYYPNEWEKKYCEGYANVSKEEVVSVVWYDSDGNEVDLPESLTITAITYLD